MAKKLFMLFLLLTSTYGCVGEVEDAAKRITESTKTGADITATFDGIYDAKAIANDKIEVYFYPASGGSNRFSYQIYVGNQPTPISVAEEVLDKDYRGLFFYTIQNLDIGTEYSLKIDVKDLVSGLVTTTTTSMSIYTFTNYVADFSGISAVSNAAGIEGVDSINVRWAHAAIPGGIFNNGDKPKSYEIILVDSNKLTPAALDDENLGADDGRTVRTIPYDPLVTETMIRGLKPNTTFYVTVRCVHEGAVNDPTAPNLRGEKNHKYKEIRTLTLSAAGIEYNPDEFLISNNSGELATTSLVVTWGDIVGVFDHLRLYYAKTPSLVINTTTCEQGGATDLLSGETLCKKADIYASGMILGDLAPQVDYQGQLLICLDPYCNDSVNYPIKTAKTSAALAGFPGIDSISLASNLAEIGTVKLNFPAVNFTTGYFDGLAIEYTTEKNDLLAWLNGEAAKPTTYLVEENEDPAHPLVHKRFDYKEDILVEIEGLNYSEELSYCFSMYPFNYDLAQPDGKKYYSDGIGWKCEKVESRAPSAIEFDGLGGAYSIRNEISLNWNEPEGGIYSHFEIFYRKASSDLDQIFSFNQAILDTTVNFDFSDYQRVLVDANDGVDGSGNQLTLSGHTIEGLADGYYLIGIGTYYNAGIGNIKRSELNTSIYQCYVSGTLSILDCQQI